MKFETPIAEVELFDLKDIISASGNTEDTSPVAPTESTDDTTDEGMVYEYNCIYHDARDNDNWDNCL